MAGDFSVELFSLTPKAISLGTRWLGQQQAEVVPPKIQVLRQGPFSRNEGRCFVTKVIVERQWVQTNLQVTAWKHLQPSGVLQKGQRVLSKASAAWACGLSTPVTQSTSGL